MNDPAAIAREKAFAEDARQQRQDDVLLATGGLCGLVYAVRWLVRHRAVYQNTEKSQ